jgi:hypothetical protein
MMRAIGALGICAALALGCGGSSRYNGQQAAMATAIAAAAAIPAAIAVNAAQAQAARAPEHPSAALTDKLRLKSVTLCVRKTSYGLYCSEDGELCVYRTNFGREYTCSEPNCAKGPPTELVRWCDPDF